MIISRGGLLVSLAIASGAVLSGVNQWLLANHFPKAEYGIFAASWTVAQVYLHFMVFGTHHFLINRGVNAYNRWILIVLAITAINGLFILCVLAALVIWVPHFFQSEHTAGLYVWALATIAVTLVFTIFQLRKQIIWIAVWPLVQIFSRTLVVLAVVWFGLDLVRVSLGYALMALLLAGVSTVVFLRSRMLTKTSSKFLSFKRVSSVWRTSLPYFSFEIMEKIDLKLFVPFCLLMFGAERSAEAAIAIGILLLALILPQGLFQRFFLVDLHVWSRRSENALTAFIVKASTIMLVLSSLIVAIIYPFVGVLIDFLFSGKYNQAIQPISIMLLVVPILLISNLINNRFLSVRNIWYLLYFQFFFLLVFILVFFYMAVNFGFLGACWSILIYRSLYLLGLLSIYSMPKGLWVGKYD